MITYTEEELVKLMNKMWQYVSYWNRTSKPVNNFAMNRSYSMDSYLKFNRVEDDDTFKYVLFL